MEIYPRRSLSLSFKTSVSAPIASSYPPTYINSKPKMYTMQEMRVRKPELPNSFGLRNSLSMNSGSQNEIPSKRNNFMNIFNAITTGVMKYIAKVPVPTATNINSTLSVTVVPNEGIISPEFFKGLTHSCEQLTADQQRENRETFEIPEKLRRSKSFSDAELKSYILDDNSKIYEISNEFTKKSSKIDETEKNELDVRLNFEKSQESQNCYNNHITMKHSSPEIPSVKESVDRKMNCSRINFDKNSSQSSKIAEKTMGCHTIRRKDFNAVPERFDSRVMSPVPEVPFKKANLSICPSSKSRRKICGLTVRRRGKGRGKSQLRRSGVSQMRHRKERTKQNIYTNIQDDLLSWEESESYDSDNEEASQSRLKNVEKISPCENNWKHCRTILENFIVDETSKGQKRKQISEDINVESQLRVVYIRDPSIITADSRDPRDVDDCIQKIPNSRHRLVSENSVTESDDSFCIVFGNTSETENTDDDYDSDSDDDSDEELDDEDSNTMQTVRFNLEPQVHMMIQWNFAYRAARRGPWEEMARDRDRFRERIHRTERILAPILVPQHRKSVWHERFGSEE